MSRLFMLLVLFLCLLALVGCSQSASDLHDDYLSRLSNVLDVATVAPEPVSPQSAPRSRELQLDIPDIRVTPLSYWNLRHCELFRLISERNSILGRVAAPSSVWRYEARVLHAIQECSEHEDTREDQQQQLADWAEEKEKAWPRATWNGTIASPEVRQIWSAAYSGWGPDNLPSLSTLHNDLQTLAAWADTWPHADIADETTFSNLYQRLGQHSSGGQWRRSVQISQAGLDAANQMLASAVEANRLCPAGTLTRSGEHAQNVLMLVFIGEVQPYLAALNRRGEQLLGDFSALTTATTVEHEAWEDFMAELRGELDTLQQTTREHAELWGELLDQCGLSVG
ncbi:DUF3080 family protein [Natronospirillum operosum]|nr:DUF3080 family protein [Natronospirillum operosum]